MRGYLEDLESNDERADDWQRGEGWEHERYG